MLKYCMGDEHGHRTGVYAAMDLTEMLPFKLIRYGEFASDPSYFTEREGLDNCLFFATISGCGVLRYAGREELLLPGRAAVIDCANYQYYATSGQETWRFAWMHFSGTAARAFVQMINGGALSVAPWQIWRAEEMFDQIDEMTRTPGRQGEFMISLWIHQLLCEMAQAVKSGAAMRYQAEMLKAAQFLREHAREPVRISDLARASGLSEYHFQRVFKNVVGQPPYAYLTRVRVDLARRLLISTDLSVSEIAGLAGYGDARGLIDNFKKYTGETPARFRRQRFTERVLP